MHWKVGRVKITKVMELETVGSTKFILPLATNEEIRKLPWLIPDFATEEGRLKMSIHSLVVETASHRIVIDTGLGNDKEGRNVPTWNNRNGPFLHRGGLPARQHRHRAVYPFARRPCRLEHEACRRPMGADLRQGALRVRQDRIRALARSQPRAEPGGGIQ